MCDDFSLSRYLETVKGEIVLMLLPKCLPQFAGEKYGCTVWRVAELSVFVQKNASELWICFKAGGLPEGKD